VKATNMDDGEQRRLFLFDTEMSPEEIAASIQSLAPDKLRVVFDEEVPAKQKRT
jgi:hypothetical protein